MGDMERIGPDIWRRRYAHPCAWEQDFAPQSMPAMFAQSVDTHGDKPLVDFLGRVYSYREIWQEAHRFAKGLEQSGFAKGDRVGVFLPNVPTYLAAYFGTLIAGGTLVNFSPLYTAEELAHQVADSGTTLMVTLDVPSLLPTALEVLRASDLKTLVVGSLAAQLPLWQGIGLRLFRRSERSPVPHAADVLHWRDFLADGDAARCRDRSGT